MLYYHKVNRVKPYLDVLAVFVVFDQMINIEPTDITLTFFNSQTISQSVANMQNIIL